MLRLKEFCKTTTVFSYQCKCQHSEKNKKSHHRIIVKNVSTLLVLRIPPGPYIHEQHFENHRNITTEATTAWGQKRRQRARLKEKNSSATQKLTYRMKSRFPVVQKVGHITVKHKRLLRILLVVPSSPQNI